MRCGRLFFRTSSGWYPRREEYSCNLKENTDLRQPDFLWLHSRGSNINVAGDDPYRIYGPAALPAVVQVLDLLC
jgi:hypothetical protein